MEKWIYFCLKKMWRERERERIWREGGGGRGRETDRDREKFTQAGIIMIPKFIMKKVKSQKY